MNLITITTSGGPNPAESTISTETTVTYETMSSEVVEIVTSEFRILSEVSPKVFRISGDYRATEVTLDKLETSLAGTVFLIEYDGHYGRLLTWLWKYGLRRAKFNKVHLGADWPDMSRPGRGYTLAGCRSETPIHGTVLERKWSWKVVYYGI